LNLYWLSEFWTTVTPAQATIFSSLATIVAAIIGVLLGTWLFSGRVRTLREAVAATDDVLKTHRNGVEATLELIREQFEILNVQTSATLENLGNLSSKVEDIQSSEEATIAAAVAQPIVPGQVPPPSREALRSDWEAIRNWLEAIAADPAVDGRTRARYSRMDRRSYLDLVTALENDGQLGDKGADMREALQLWARFRTGRAAPTSGDVHRMAELRRKLTDDRADDNA